MLKYYDFIIFMFVADALSQAFFPSDASPWINQMQTLDIFAIGYFVRPIAGLVFAHIADMVGRKRMFIFLLVLMSVPTFLIGVMPTYAQVGVWAPILLLVMRALQGCAVGGEFPSASVFVSEHAKPHRLGTTSGVMSGIIQTGLLLGAGAAVLAAAIAKHADIPSLAWRLPFIVSGVLGLTSTYLRRQLEESPLYEEIRQSHQLADSLPVKLVLIHHRNACLIGLIIGLAMAVGATLFLQPLLMSTQYGVPCEQALQANMVGALALCVSMPVWGRLADTTGWARALGISAAAILLAALSFFWFLPNVLAGTGSLAVLFIPLNVAFGAMLGLVPGLLSALFPTSIRQSGYALLYSLVAIFAGVMPLLLA